MTLMLHLHAIEPVEAEVHQGIADLDGLRLPVTLIGALPPDASERPLAVEAALDEILDCRSCGAEAEADGFLPAGDAILLRGSVRRRYPHGSYDIDLGQGRELMLDQDELGSLRPQPGDRIAIRFRGLVCVIDGER